MRSLSREEPRVASSDCLKSSHRVHLDTATRFQRLVILSAAKNLGLCLLLAGPERQRPFASLRVTCRTMVVVSRCAPSHSQRVPLGSFVLSESQAAFRICILILFLSAPAPLEARQACSGSFRCRGRVLPAHIPALWPCQLKAFCRQHPNPILQWPV